MLFNPNDLRMAGKIYLDDDDPELKASREAYLTWRALTNPKDGDPIPDEARLWWITRARVARVAKDPQTGELFIHEYLDWQLVPSNEVEYVGYDEESSRVDV